MEEVTNFLGQLTPMITEYAGRLVLGILVLFVGLKVVHRIARSVRSAVTRSGLSEEITPFLSSFVSVMLKVLLVFSVAAIFGIDVTSFVAVLAAAGFAIGLALQGSLSNFAAGILILLFRPYRVGEWVEVNDKFGKVEEIQVFNTLIITPGRKTLIIPNGQIVEGIVTNFSKKGFIRLELQASMPYEESFPRVREIILGELRQMPAVMPTPAPEVGIESFDSHYVVVGVKPYIDPDDYWPVTFEVHQRIKRAFHEHNIKMAYSEGVELGVIGE